MVKSKAFCLISIMLIFLIGCYESTMDEEKAKKVLNNFYTDNVPESINDRYLVSAGKAIVPYVLVEIQKRDMPKRGYAILALGKIGDRRALTVLKKILDDKSELLGDRTAALQSIWHIDRKLGEELAKKYSGENEYLDRHIQLLREGKI